MRLRSDAYLLSQVQGASPQRLRLLLIEGALRLAHRAIHQLQEARFDEATNTIIDCQAIVVELMTSPDRQRVPELAGQIASLYLFVHKRLTAAQIQRQSALVSDAVTVLEIERDTWRQLCARLDAVPAAHFPVAGVEAAGISLEA